MRCWGPGVGRFTCRCPVPRSPKGSAREGSSRKPPGQCPVHSPPETAAPRRLWVLGPCSPSFCGEEERTVGRGDRLAHNHPRGESATTGLGARPRLRRLHSSAGGALAGGGEARGAPPARTPKRERTIPKRSARTDAHTRKAPGPRTDTVTRATTCAHRVHSSFPRRAWARGPEEGASPRARRAAAGGRGRRGGLPARGLGRRGSRQRPWSLRRGGARAALGPASQALAAAAAALDARSPR